MTERMATAAELANYRCWVAEKKLFAADEVAPLLAHITYLHGLLGWAGELLGEPCTMEAIREQREVAQTIDALLTEHGRREGE